MAEIALAIGAMLLAFLLGKLRRARIARSASGRADLPAGVTLEDMTDLISELAPTLREPAMVTAPQTYVDRGHVWSSPCGKRVYIN